MSTTHQSLSTRTSVCIPSVEVPQQVVRIGSDPPYPSFYFTQPARKVRSSASRHLSTAMLTGGFTPGPIHPPQAIRYSKQCPTSHPAASIAFPAPRSLHAMCLSKHVKPRHAAHSPRATRAPRRARPATHQHALHRAHLLGEPRGSAEHASEGGGRAWQGCRSMEGRSW